MELVNITRIIFPFILFPCLPDSTAQDLSSTVGSYALHPCFM